MKNKTNFFKKGFTMIELLVAATIIIVLTTIGMVSYQNAAKKGRDAKRQTDLQTVRQALVLQKADGVAYPTGGSFSTIVGNLQSDGYLSSDPIIDPKNVSPYVYAYSGNGTTFTLTVTLETTGTVYTVPESLNDESRLYSY